MEKKNSKKKNSRRNKIFIVIIALLVVTNAFTVLYFSVIRDYVPMEDVPISFNTVMDSKEDYIGKTITVDGYFVLAGGIPIMISDPMVFRNNSIGTNNSMTFSNYIPPSLAQSYVGKRCAVKAEVGWDEGYADGIELTYYNITPSDTEINTGNNCNDNIVNMSEALEHITIFDPTSEKYAVLYCGGIDELNLYNRFWNDLTSLYLVLLMYGYQPANIRVVYRDGTGNDNQIPVDAEANSAGLSGVLADLQTEMGASDKLFMYITNHGNVGIFGSWYAPAISYSSVNTWISSITMDSLILISQTCRSGSLIPTLSGPNRLLISACNASGSAWMADTEGPWDEFSFHFFSALLQYRINGDPTPVLSDVNYDGYVSMTEAFNYAVTQDNTGAQPLLDDNGDGVGSSWGDATGGDGVNGISIFL